MAALELQVALGLTAALAWGLGDLFSRGPTGRIGTPGLILVLGGVGALALISLIAVLGEPFPSGAPWWAWAFAAGLGLLNVLAAHLIFRCFYEGPLSITSPVSASYAAVTFVLGLLTGETASALGYAGLILVLVGVPLAATPHFRESLSRAPSRGILLALGASLLYGFIFWAFKYVTPHLGGPYTTLVARVEQFLLIGILLLVGAVHLPATARASWRPWAVAGGVALLDTTAMAATVTGTSGGSSTVVTAIGSAYAVVTVGCAMVFLRERLVPHQWAGVGLVVAGVLLVSLG